MSSTLETPAPAKPEVMLRVPVGLASPLWGFFAGAAVGGAAFWWMTRWTTPQNLEAMFGKAAPAEEVVEAPVEAPVEVLVEPVLVEAEVAAPEAVEPVMQAAPEPVAELVAEPPPEAVADPEPSVAALAEPEAVTEAPALAAKPRAKKAAAKAD
jgi:hypothetical protein